VPHRDSYPQPSCLKHSLNQLWYRETLCSIYSYSRNVITQLVLHCNNQLHYLLSKPSIEAQWESGDNVLKIPGVHWIGYRVDGSQSGHNQALPLSRLEIQSLSSADGLRHN
jgi:hypothetical protein